jgi:hypothetical protein
VQLEIAAGDAQLAGALALEDRDDLAHVVVAQRHGGQSRFSPAPNVDMISDIAETPFGPSGRAALPVAVTGRAWRT